MRDHRLNRQPSGPGRSTRRPRASSPASASPQAGEQAAPPSRLAQVAARLPRPRNHLAFTRRALVLFAVLAVLALSYAGSLRVWMVQSQELALANTQIAERTARVEALEEELARWDDDAYVKAQARERLGWVMPGEVGYRIIAADGTVLAGSSDIEGVGTAQASELASRWWDRLASSLRQADEPPATSVTADQTEDADADAGTATDSAGDDSTGR